MAELRHREVAADCGPAEGPAALFCLAFPSAYVPAAVWLSPSLLLAFQIWFETGQWVQKLQELGMGQKLERQAKQLELPFRALAGKGQTPTFNVTDELTLQTAYFLRKLC